MSDFVVIDPNPLELQRCPFCGSDAAFEHDSSGLLPKWRVYCRETEDADCPIGYTNTIGYSRRVEAATA